MVQVISDTIQEYNGERFYLCGAYFQHKGKRLHRVVWESLHGPVPKGYHVHHNDGNKANNCSDNLTLVEGELHILRHAGEPSRRANGRRAIKFAIAAAPEWHASEEGKAWHSAHSLESWEKRPLRDYICTQCGKVFATRHIYGKIENHFCGNNCRATYRRRRVAAERKTA